MSDKILKFYSKTCMPCKMLTATLEGEDLGVGVESVDIDQQAALAQSFGIRGVPTMILIRDDKEQARLSGVHTINKIREWVTSNS